MPDLFLACVGGLACLLTPFGLAFLATRDRYAAEAEQFPLPANDINFEPDNAARNAAGR